MLMSRIYALGSISLAIVFGTPAMADIMGFNNGANFTANGTASFSGNTLTLTSSQVNQNGSAFYDSVQSIAGGWNASFTYQATQPGGICFCDGAAFILQNAAAGAHALGTQDGGGGYAYYIISPSAAIEFSPDGSFSPGAPGTGFYTNGLTPQDGGAPLLPTSPVNFASKDPIQVNVTFAGNGMGIGDLRETLVDETTLATFTHDYGIVNLESIVGGPTAFIGFSGATGAGASTQTISNFSFTPEPSSWALLATVLATCLWLGRRTLARRRL
jgi:hypothetical protein